MQGLLFQDQAVPVNGSRLRQARELRGLTQASLGEAVGVDQTMIAHIEGGTKSPTLELLETLAQILGLATGFFKQSDPLEMPKGSLLFRSKAVVGKRTVSQAYERSRLAVEFALRLSAHATLVPMRIPTCAEALTGAREVRRVLELPPGPLSTVIRQVERLGVIVVPIGDIKDCDAFATWAGAERDVPVIGLASGSPTDRLRLSCAHELGHLVLHRSLKSASKDDEQEAYRFAAELLMPSQDITPEFRDQKLTLFRLAELKGHWGVSMQALARRARELEVINDRQYRYLMMQMSQRGWRTEEPVFHPQAEEKPRAIRKLVEVVCGPEIRLPSIAAEFNLSISFINALLQRCDGLPFETGEKVAKDGLGSSSRILSIRRIAG